MKTIEYQKLAVRTMASLGSHQADLSHMVLGMCSELSELQDAIENQDEVNIGEELADFQWYLSNYNTLQGYEFRDMVAMIDSYEVMDIYYVVSELQDMVKKYIAYNKPVNPVSEIPLLDTLQHLINSQYLRYDLKQEDYLRKNIEKLQARYPEKFTQDNAINRDLDTERKILES